MKLSRTEIRAAGKKAEVLIYEEIGESFFGGLGAKAFAGQLSALSDVTELTVRINSIGGSVWEGMAIYNALKGHPAKKNVVIDGIAASMASLIAMAGDTIKIQPTAMMMVHNAFTSVYGDCNGLRETADLLDAVSGQMAKAYARSGKSETDIRAIMDEEVWYTADEAVAQGWADALVEEPLKMAAKIHAFDPKAFRKVPDWVKAMVTAVDCTCDCPECKDGDCAECSHAGCDCVGCDCPKMTGKVKEKAKIAAISEEIQPKTLIAARIRERNLRLAELS